MPSKEIIKAYYGNYFISIGQLYVIVTGQESNENDKILTEWFYLIVKNRTQWHANAFSISSRKCSEIFPNIEHFIQIITIPTVKNWIYNNEILPIIDKQPAFYELYPEVKLFETDKSILLQIKYECPKFIERTIALTKCDTLREYLNLINKIDIKIESEKLDY